MNKIALRHAWEDFHLAKLAAARLQAASSFAEVETEWAAFLSASGRVFNKLHAATKGVGKAQAWFGGVVAERRNDPLLQYIHHARNCREHLGLEITKRQGGYMAITGDVRIKQMSFGPAGRRGEVQSTNPARPARVVFEPARVLLIPVVDSGREYEPPPSHRGNPIDSRDPVTVARLTVTYLEEKLREAGAFAV